jgi:hypothetical protein
MATYSGTNYTKYAAPSPPTYMGPEWEGDICVLVENYTFASAAIATVVNVGILRKGEVFVEGYITGADLGSATTLTLGDTPLDPTILLTAGVAARYLAATVFTTANQITWCNAATGRGFKPLQDMILILTTGVEEALGLVNVVIKKART